MINQHTDMKLSPIPNLRLLISQSGSPVLSQKLNLLSRKRSSSDLFDKSCSNTNEHQPAKRQRPTVSFESKVPPSKVGLSSYGPNDVLSGRGGGTNQHEGNCFFRSLINKNRERYLRAKKNDKPFISLSIVNTVRQRNGRFLKKEESSGLWFEIGDALAREKTSQALRQRAPEYRKQLLEHDNMLSSPLRQIQQSSMSPLPAPLSPTRSMDGDIAKDILRGALEARVRQTAEIQEARQVLRLHQKLQAIKVLELELMLQNSNRFFR